MSSAGLVYLHFGKDVIRILMSLELGVKDHLDLGIIDKLLILCIYYFFFLNFIKLSYFDFLDKKYSLNFFILKTFLRFI